MLMHRQSGVRPPPPARRDSPEKMDQISVM